MFWEWISSFLAYFGFSRKSKLLIIGLDNAGKSTLLDRIGTGKLVQNIPTFQPRSRSLQMGHVNFTAYDLGGHVHIRRVWRDYMLAVDGIIFVVDTADTARFTEAYEEIDSLLHDETTQDVPIAFLFNKTDLKEAVGEEYLADQLRLKQIRTGKEHIPRHEFNSRPMETFPCSILRQQGYGQALRWLAYYMDHWFVRKYKLLIIGIDNAGTSFLFDIIDTGKLGLNKPTFHPRATSLQIGHVHFTALDIVGKKHMRHMVEPDGIIFMVDAAETSLFAEAHKEIESLLHDETTQDVPIAFLFNKTDLKEAVGQEYLVDQLGLKQIRTGKEHIPRHEFNSRPVETFPCSILRQQGYSQALRWMAYYMEH